jgi:hypothetical protein
VSTNPTGWKLTSLRLSDGEAGGPALAEGDFQCLTVPSLRAMVDAWIDERDLAPIRVELRSADLSVPLVSTDLRIVPLARLVSLMSAELNSRRRRDDLLRDETVTRKEISRSARAFMNKPRPGRRGRSDEYYLGVVLAYFEAMQDPRTANAPVQAVAGQMIMKPDSVRALIREARRRGLVERQQQGKAGIRLKPKAIELLERAVAKKTLEQKAKN